MEKILLVREIKIIILGFTLATNILAQITFFSGFVRLFLNTNH